MISIITPTYNSEKYILNNLQSIHCNQDYDNIEQIIIDGNSTDSTIEIIDQFKKANKSNIKLVVGQDKNMYDAINKGMKLIEGDIWACLNSDDQYHPNIMQRVIHYYEKHQNIDVITGDYFHVDNNGKTIYRKVNPPFNRNRLLRMGWCIISQPATFLKKSVIDKIGYFDVNYNYVADYDYFIRVANNVKIKQVHFPITFDRIHDSSLTSNHSEEMRAESSAIQNIYYNSEKDRIITRIINRMDKYYYTVPSLLHPNNFRYYLGKIKNKIL
jgi:glycosyltransferase involved in cell wall biosynthesis